MDGDADVGFLDVTANALAVVLIATLFALQALETQKEVLTDPWARSDPLLSFPIRRWAALTEFNDYYLIRSDGALFFDRDRLVAALLESGRTSGAFPEGVIVLTPLYRVRGQDLGDYRITWQPPAEGRGEVLPLDTEEDLAAFVRRLEDRYVRRHRAATFFVRPEAMATFGRLHGLLEDRHRNLRWRWQPWTLPEIRITRATSTGWMMYR
jgi:hypothetical protein